MTIDIPGARIRGKVVASSVAAGLDWGTSTRALLKRMLDAPVDLPRLLRADFESEEAFAEARRDEPQKLIDYWNSDQSLKAWMARRSYVVPLSSEGAFEVEGIPDGEYILQVLPNRSPGRPNTEAKRLDFRGLKAEVTISGTRSKRSIHLGTINLEPIPRSWIYY